MDKEILIQETEASIVSLIEITQNLQNGNKKQRKFAQTRLEKIFTQFDKNIDEAIDNFDIRSSQNQENIFSCREHIGKREYNQAIKLLQSYLPFKNFITYF